MAQYLNEVLSGVGDPDDSDVIDWPGGPGVFACQGTFGAGVVFQLRVSIDGGTTWSDVSGAELTIIGNDMGAFQLPPCKLRARWTGGDSSTSVRVLVAPSCAGWWNDPTNLPTT
jgi:hypothetical protein